MEVEFLKAKQADCEKSACHNRPLQQTTQMCGGEYQR